MKFKWLIPIATLFVASILLTGCQFPFVADTETDEEDAYEFVTYEGLLQSLGSVKFNPDATHLLRLDDETVLYVYSDFYNLWDTTYLNENVEASGLLIPGEGEEDKPVLAIEQLTVLEVEEVVEVEDANMETFVSESLGFAIDYQSDWEVEERTQAVSFYAPQPEDAAEFVETDVIQVSYMLNNDDLDIEEWFLAYESAETEYALSVISVDQIPALKVQDETSITYYIQGEGYVYVALFLSHQEDMAIISANLFKDMLLSFDLLSDGQREVEEITEEVEETETEVFDSVLDEDAEEIADVEVTETSHAVTISSLEAFLGNVTPLTYDFVEPNYIYVTYTEDDVLKRMLLEDVGGGKFETLAEFEEGSITDWELVSGEDVAKGLTQTSVDADTGSTTVILEGYRPLESAVLHFQMQYPSNWYYSRSGDFFYFSTEPADASNALVTLEIRDESVSSLKTWDSSGLYFADVPRDEDSSYRLNGSLDLMDTIKIMAESIQPTS